MASSCSRSMATLLLLLSSALLHFSSASPIHQNEAANPEKEKKFFGQPAPSPGMRGFFPAARNWAQAPILMPYADGSGFVSSFPSGLSDRWSGFLAAEQFAGGAPNKRTSEGHFMEPSGWLGLGEPGRLEWNFNRLR